MRLVRNGRHGGERWFAGTGGRLISAALIRSNATSLWACGPVGVGLDEVGWSACVSHRCRALLCFASYMGWTWRCCCASQ